METLLCDLPNICVYIDDILISGKTEADHLYNLELVLSRLSSAGITMKCSKSIFAMTSNTWATLLITKDCTLHHQNYKLSNKHLLLPNLSSTLSPLHLLLCKGTKWTWTVSTNCLQQSQTTFAIFFSASTF